MIGVFKVIYPPKVFPKNAIRSQDGRVELRQTLWQMPRGYTTLSVYAFNGVTRKRYTSVLYRAQVDRDNAIETKQQLLRTMCDTLAILNGEDYVLVGDNTTNQEGESK